VVLAENEDALARIGWEPLSAGLGFKRGSNVVTISRYTGGDVIASVHGNSADELLPYLADAITKQVGWQLVFTVGMATGSQQPLLVFEPDPSRDDGPVRLLKARRTGIPVQARAYSGTEVRTVYRQICKMDSNRRSWLFDRNR
jgi:hypothetical protein